MTADQLRVIADAIAEECKVDFVGIWAVLWEVKQAFPDASEPDAKEKTFTVLRYLLNMTVVSGEFEQEKFWAWKVSPDEALARVRERWDSLGREPDIGDIGWLAEADAAPSR